MTFFNLNSIKKKSKSVKYIMKLELLDSEIAHIIVIIGICNNGLHCYDRLTNILYHLLELHHWIIF